MKIAIIGFEKDTYGAAPWLDPSWEKWGMPWDRTDLVLYNNNTEIQLKPGWEKYNVLFEMHYKTVLDVQMGSLITEEVDENGKFEREFYRPEHYMKSLRKLARSKKHILYTQDSSVVSGPAVREYPIEETDKVVGHYYCSSVGYMVALALLKILQTGNPREHEIGLWGVDMKGSGEYVYQKPNLEYMLGIAKGLGITVSVPETIPLLKFQPQDVDWGATMIRYEDRYGKPVLPQKFGRKFVGLHHEIKHVLESKDSATSTDTA